MEQSAAAGKKEKIFFPNLDGLRFMSFFVVYLFHIWLLMFDRYSLTGNTSSIVKFLFQNGEIGVNFFFVLSGFLITYLLIQEKKLTGKIHVGNFYVRRILRIWPLFYVCILFGLVLYPLKKFIGGDVFEVAHPWTYFVFLNNFDFMKNGAPAIISVLWSVAIEEQFYLFWPLLLSLTPIKYYRPLLFTIIIGSFIFRCFNYDDERVLQFHTLAVIGDMALGGLFAYYIIFSERFKIKIESLTKSSIAILYSAALIVFLFRKNIFPGSLMVFERIVIALICGLIILEQNFSKNSFFKMSSFKSISKWGIYTYGLYCIHVIVITFTEIAFKKAGLNMQSPLIILLLTIVAFTGCMSAAFVSYNFFEKRFLKLKDRFAFIVKN